MLWFSNYSVQGHLDNFVEAVDSTYGCVLLRGQILTATKNWWGLHPDEIVLIMNYLLSEIPAVLKDTPVFLPVKSPTVSCLKAKNIYTFFHKHTCVQQFVGITVCTLISLINVEPTLTNFEKFHPPQKKSPLHVY